MYDASVFSSITLVDITLGLMNKVTFGSSKYYSIG